MGANKEYIEREIPHLASLLSDDLGAVLAHAEVIVVGKDSPEVRAMGPHLRPGQVVLDLAKVPGLADVQGVEYRGIVW